MNFAENIAINTNLLENTGLLDDVYKALSAMDMSAAVLAALDGMRQVGSLLVSPKSEKNSDMSRKYRTEGNEHYTNQRYLNALVCYNIALQLAPLHSTDLLIAYSNRSQLLLKLNAYTAAFNDIETCLKLQCEGDLLKKINKRKNECLKMMWEEKLGHDALLKGFPEEFFKFNQETHQREAYLAWEFMKNTQMLQQQGGSLMFHVTCNSLKVLRDLVNTKEHMAVYADFRRQLSLCQQAVTRNSTI